MILEPLKPLSRGFYRCDNRFHTELLEEMLVDDHKRFGFIIMDGSAASFYVLAGKHRETLFEWSKVNLPNKHHRGGQSQNRMARIREEKRGVYVNRVAELAVDHFITNDLPNVQGLVLAGCADLKSEMASRLDPRLKAVVLGVIDVQYNGISGFNECIEKCADLLKGSEYFQERKLISKFFEAVKTDEPVVYGVEETMKALLESGGAVDQLLIAETLAVVRYVLTPNSVKNEADNVIFYGDAVSVRAKLEDGFKIASSQSLLNWILDNVKEFGATVELISEGSPMANQFSTGFGGLAALLRYQWVPEFDEKGAEDEADAVFEW